MDALIPRHGTDIDLHEFYGRKWLEPGGVRVNFISSADGGVSASGLSKGLQTAGDNKVFAALRDLADVVLVGASTAAVENYRPIQLSQQRRAVRNHLGLSDLPAIAVVSGSLNIDLNAPLYCEAKAESPTIIITGPKAPIGRLNDIIDLAAGPAAVQLIEAGAGQGGVDFAEAITHLHELGYRRVLCEGGPRLFNAGLVSGSVTELCLSISPLLVGPGIPRIINGDAWPDQAIRKLELTGLLSEDGALFCRYAVVAQK